MSASNGVVVKISDNRLGEIARRLPIAAGMVVEKTTLDIQREIVDRMHDPKSGHIYPRPGGKHHQASAPGEAPAIDTAALANSIQVEMSAGGLQGEVFTNLETAPKLEFGNGRILARPFMGPAGEKMRDSFVRALTQLEGKLK